MRAIETQKWGPRRWQMALLAVLALAPAVRLAYVFEVNANESPDVYTALDQMENR
jgi:hypothetical protein